MHPVDVANLIVENNRGTGKTSRLIESLPDAPCFVMIHQLSFQTYFKELVKKIRPDYNLDNITFVGYHGHNWRDHTQMRNKPLFVDHWVYEQDFPRFVKALNSTYGVKYE